MNNMPWFKLYPEIINDPKIRRLTVDERWLWIVLLCLAAQSPDREAGKVCITEGMPYEPQDLSGLCGYHYEDFIDGSMGPNEMVKHALSKFEKLKMITRDASGVICITNFDKRQNTYLTDAERAKRYRENKKLGVVDENDNQSNVTVVTQSSKIVTLDKDKDKDKEEDLNIKYSCATSSREFEQTETKLSGQAVEAQTQSPENAEADRVAGRPKQKSVLIQALATQFGQFWSAYPKRKNKGDAEKAWSQLRPDEQLFAKILQSIERAKTSDDWRKEGGKFIPYPGAWIRGKRWEDEITESEVTHGTRSIDHPARPSKEDERFARNLEALRTYGQQVGAIKREVLPGGDQCFDASFSEFGVEPQQIAPVENDRFGFE